ncbi:MAG: serine/threonine-protein kinase [Actinomycetes bacterium]
MEAPARESVASALEGYDIGDELGRGGFGVVVGGRHRRLERPVAIKQLPPALAADSGVRMRFATEAKVLASLDHPHIVPVYDYVERDGLCLLVMEALPGGTVWQAFSHTGFTAETACAVGLVTCAGLEHAHRHGVLHRDVKPENLLFNAAGQIKVTDFGIAKVVGGSQALATSSGDILGTPAYMAPEQAEGKELGPPADVYATGVMLYELLSGRLPFSEEGGGLAIVYRHVYERPTPLMEVAPALPPEIAAVVMRALSRDPGDRPQTAEELGVEIATAASAAFGAGWLDRAGVPLLAGGPILASAERDTLPQQRAAVADLDAPRETVVGAAPDVVDLRAGTPVPAAARSTNPPAAAGGAPPTLRPGGAGTPPTAPAAPAVVRPSALVHVVGQAPASLSEGLVPVGSVLQLPPRPVAAVAVSAALLSLAVGVAAIGIGAPSLDRTVPAGAMTLAGVDLASGERVVADLAEPIELVVASVPPAATEVELAVQVAGIPLVTSGREPLTPSAGGVRAELDASGDQYLAAGPVVGTVRFTDADGDEVAATDVMVEPAAGGMATVPGAVVVVLMLAVLAWAESLARPLRRRGRRRIGSIVGLGVVGAAFAATCVVGAWVLGWADLTIATAVVAAPLGALGGAALAMAALRTGLRARLRRAARKQGVDIAAPRKTAVAA